MIREGNPPLGNKMQLFCRKGNNCLAIYADGTIKGTEDRNDPHSIVSSQLNQRRKMISHFSAHLQIISARSPGHVKIQGTLARLFVTMNNDGKLQGQVSFYKSSLVTNIHWNCFSLTLK